MELNLHANATTTPFNTFIAPYVTKYGYTQNGSAVASGTVGFFPQIDRADFWSKTKNSPFDERPVQGQVMATIVGGRTIYRHDNFTPTAAVA